MRPQLAQARALLDGRMSVKSHSARAAAWLTRSALEDIVRELVRAKGAEPGRASNRSVLSCLEVLYGDQSDLVVDAQYAWDALSRAAHHHAYELAPTVAEVTDLMRRVNSLDQLSKGSPTQVVMGA